MVFGHEASPKPMEFFGRYLEVTPYSRLVWTNDEGEDGGAVTTVTFEEKAGKTLLVMHDLYPSKAGRQPPSLTNIAQVCGSWTIKNLVNAKLRAGLA